MAKIAVIEQDSVFKVGDRVLVLDPHCWYRDRMVTVLRECGPQHPDVFVVGFTTPAGGSIEWVTSRRYLSLAPTKA